MRGDRPCCGGPGGTEGRFTPHARGSTLFTFNYQKMFMVYPACAGIDLVGQFMSRKLLRLPRMRGDRPQRQVTKDGL